MRPDDESTPHLQDSDDARTVIAYAMLIEPSLWTPEGRPRPDALADDRVANSISAACRIMAYRGEDLSDGVELRLIEGAYAVCDMSSLAIAPDVEPSEMADLVNILLSGGGGSDRYEEYDTVDVPPTTIDDMPLDAAFEVDASDEPGDAYEAVDPDLDPEAGISHPGDEDEGRYMGGHE